MTWTNAASIKMALPPLDAVTCAVFSTLQSEDWYRTDEIAVITGIPVRAVRAITDALYDNGLIVRRAAYPSYRYRALPKSMQVYEEHRQYFAELAAMTRR